MADITNWLVDVDGVLIHGECTLPGASESLSALCEREVPFLVLTSDSIFIRHDLSAQLVSSGLDVSEENIWTSVATTATFLATQSDSRRAYVVGEAGLTTTLYEHGSVATNDNPDFVVLGEICTYNIEVLAQAIRLAGKSARFIVTNPDITGPSVDGPIPATGAVVATITAVADKTLYYMGKPDPAMLRTGLNRIDTHSGQTTLVGDRMDTDTLAGTRMGL